jgi:hypothetical protein
VDDGLFGSQLSLTGVALKTPRGGILSEIAILQQPTTQVSLGTTLQIIGPSTSPWLNMAVQENLSLFVNG